MATGNLFEPELRSPVAPGGRREPRLWVRRLAIFDNPHVVRRDIHLKPGLNIVWTPDMSTSEQEKLAHGSGKTTFCRLLRACLGEPGYASGELRSRVMARIPDGLAAAEIIVDGVCWVAVRHLGAGGKDYVASVDSVEAALARGRQAGDPENVDRTITEAFFANLMGRAPSNVGNEGIWDVLRAWLSRDQECRLAEVLDWRTPKTESRSRALKLNKTARLNMVRLALRALDDEEQAASEHMKRDADAAGAERERMEYLRRYRNIKLAEIRKELDVGEGVGLEDELGRKGLASLAQEAFEKARRETLSEFPDFRGLYERYESENARKISLREEKARLDGDARTKRQEAERLRDEAGKSEADAGEGRIGECPICRARVDEALARERGISLEKRDPQDMIAEVATRRDEAERLEEEARRAESESERLAAGIEQVEVELRAINQRAIDADHEARDAAYRAQERAYRFRRAVDTVRELRDVSRELEPSPIAKGLHSAARAQKERGRRRAREALLALEERYRWIISNWLPDGIDGEIKLAGNRLSVEAKLTGRGEVATAALGCLKILAFDLSALHLAVEEEADLPPILIHDSPREADLDSTLYARLFEMMHRWETEVAHPCFQYIVTTTTAPPEAMRDGPDLVLTMSSTPKEERLFRMDL